ncbi:hypothetical protein CRUP_008266 [Coryphaenoides rupestris]|nr:hypothetical protein CRUP_008266 [Coryphaenoides rupestris]
MIGRSLGSADAAAGAPGTEAIRERDTRWVLLAAYSVGALMKQKQQQQQQQVVLMLMLEEVVMVMVVLMLRAKYSCRLMPPERAPGPDTLTPGCCSTLSRVVFLMAAGEICSWSAKNCSSLTVAPSRTTTGVLVMQRITLGSERY